MSVVQALYHKESEDKSMNINDYLDIIFFILNRILDFTKDSEEKTPSIFDHYHHNQDNDKDSLSTSYSDSSNSDSDICCELDKYDIEDFIIQTYQKLGFTSNLLILSMMNFCMIRIRPKNCTRKLSRSIRIPNMPNKLRQILACA